MSMTLTEISNLTEDNMHTEAYIQGCLYIGLPENGYMVSSLRAIEVKHMQLGYLPGDLNTYRYEIYKDMMRMAKLSMGENEYQEFNRCF